MYSRSIKIQIQNLNKSFGNKQVLSDVNLQVKAGESLVVIGGSGTGKSVLLKNILGLMIPDSDSKIIIEGDDLTYTHISKRNSFIKKFGMLFQGGALFDGFPIWYNISFTRLVSGKITKAEAYELALKKLKMVELGKEVADLYPSEISGGMQKRVALARAIAYDPEIIFFDEPTAGLDPVTADVISQLIKNLSKELNATTVTITHDISCMYTIADTVAMLKKGKVEWYDKLDKVKDATNEHLLEFIKP